MVLLDLQNIKIINENVIIKKQTNNIKNIRNVTNYMLWIKIVKSIDISMLDYDILHIEYSCYR